MSITIPRKSRVDIPETVFLGIEDPSRPSGLDKLLHELTPILVYTGANGRDYVRWSMPREVAQRYGWGDMRCACCPPDEPSTVAATVDAFHVDIAWSNTAAYLTMHGYRRAVVPQTG